MFKKEKEKAYHYDGRESPFPSILFKTHTITFYKKDGTTEVFDNVDSFNISETDYKGNKKEFAYVLSGNVNKDSKSNYIRFSDVLRIEKKSHGYLVYSDELLAAGKTNER